MSTDRHSYVAFYPSDWIGGTARMTPMQELVYFRVCCWIWDKAAPCPRSELPLMLGAIDDWRGVIDDLLASGKLTDEGDFIGSPRAEIEANKARDLWEKKSRGGKRGASKTNANSGKSMTPDGSADGTHGGSHDDSDAESDDGTGAGVPAQNQNQNQKGKAARANALPPADEFSLPRDMQPKCRLADKFVDLYEQHWPNNASLPPPTMGLESEAANWLVRLSESKIAEIMETQFRQLAAKGLSPPRGFKLLQRDLETAAGKARGTSDEGAASSVRRSAESQSYAEQQRRRTRWTILSNKPVLSDGEAAEFAGLDQVFGRKAG